MADTVSIEEIHNTDYITDSIAKINTNCETLATAINTVNSALSVSVSDSGVGTIGKTTPVAKVRTNAVEVINGGVYIYDKNSDGAVAYITYDETTGKSTLSADIVSAKTIENSSAVDVKSVNTDNELDSEKSVVAITGDYSNYIVTCLVDTPSSPNAIDVELTFTDCVDNQSVNIIFGELNDYEINSISISSANYEFANQYDSDDTKKLDPSLIIDGSYNTQLSFLIKNSSTSGTNKIIVLK